ncbi:MAG: hypothetical protein LBK64_02455 [Spirochaetaceae bacterium]|jgi:hypothetical protein|nr:hypothetical protein [Spirochaetaceae bacterium]
MKKTIMLSVVFAVLVCVQGFSQNWIVGGEVGLSFGSTKRGGTTSTSSFTLSPMVGYVISDKIDVGGRLILERRDIGITDSTEFGLAAWGRYHLLSLGSLELRALGDIGFSNTSYSSGSDEKKFWIAVLPNFEYRFTDRVSIYTNIGLVKFERSWRNSNYSDTDFSLGVSTKDISIGFFLRF